MKLHRYTASCIYEYVKQKGSVKVLMSFSFGIDVFVICWWCGSCFCGVFLWWCGGVFVVV